MDKTVKNRSNFFVDLEHIITNINWGWMSSDTTDWAVNFRNNSINKLEGLAMYNTSQGPQIC